MWPATDSLGTSFQQDEVITALAALAQQTRLELMKLLASVGSEGLTAGDIATRLNVAPASLSFHFRQLVSAGLLKHYRRSRFIYYAVDRSRVTAVLDYLDDWCSAPEPG